LKCFITEIIFFVNGGYRLVSPFFRAMTDLEKIIGDLLIVVVLFRRKPEESQAVMSLNETLAGLPTRPKIFIYDNSPLASAVASSMIYVHDPSNSGVGKAYNRAAAFAHSAHKKWMLLLDQDTTLAPGLFQAWCNALIRHPASVAFVPRMNDAHGPVSPFALFMGGGRRMGSIRETLPLARYRFVNSGLFIQCDAFAKAGGYDEKIPLDFSDVLYGHRLRKVMDHFILIDCTLQHDLSSTVRLPAAEAVRRFGYFCRGARSMQLESRAGYQYIARAFLRALHLTVIYRKITFVRTFFNSANG
jgi:glycosyltransferase involved in cell wall biosynthesis